MVTDRFKSGLHPPRDIPFEDLSNGQTSHNQNNASHTPRGGTLRDKTQGTVSGGKARKRTGIFGIFSGSKVRRMWLRTCKSRVIQLSKQ